MAVGYSAKSFKSMIISITPLIDFLIFPGWASLYKYLKKSVIDDLMFKILEGYLHTRHVIN